MLWEALRWFVSWVEVIAVIACLLAGGLMIAIAAFWLLSRSLGKLTDPPVEADLDDYDW